MTTVYVTHDQREALTMSDRIAVIDHGRIGQIDDAARPLRAPRQPLRRRVHRRVALPPVQVRNGGAYLGDTALKLSHPPRHGAPAQLLVLRPEKLKVVRSGGTAPASTCLPATCRNSSTRAKARCCTYRCLAVSRSPSAIPRVAPSAPCRRSARRSSSGWRRAIPSSFRRTRRDADGRAR